jgi:hypothetical protein
MRKTVAAIRRHLNIQNVVVATFFDRVHRQANIRQPFPHILRRKGSAG